MFKQVAFCLVIWSQLVALKCSEPVTLSPTVHGKVTHLKLSTMDHGDLIAYWFHDDDERKIQVSLKPSVGDWLPAETIVKDSHLSQLECFINHQGTINLYWKKEESNTSKQHHIQKTVNGPWSKVEEFEIIKDSIKNAKDSAPYRFGDHISLLESSRGSDHFLLFEIISHQQKNILHKRLSKARSFHGIGYDYDPTGRVCVVWGQFEKIGRFYAEKKYTLEAAWLKEGSVPVQRETICSFSENKAFKDLRVAVDPRDNVVVIWCTGKDGRETIETVSKSEGKWSSLETISPVLEHVSHLQLICDNQGNALALWRVKRADKIFLCSAYKPYGKPWAAAEDVSSLNRDQPVLIKADYAGNFIAIWNELDEPKTIPLYGAIFSTLKQKWTSPVKLSPPGQNYIASDMVFSQQGKGYIGWINATDLKKEVAQVAELTVETLPK